MGRNKGENMKTIHVQTSRRQFMKWAGVGLGAMTLTHLKAGAQVQPTPDPVEPVCPTPGLLAEIDRNHGHALDVDLANLKLNGPKVYSIKGASGHDHLLDLNPAALLTLFLKGVVEVESQVGAGHVHLVRIELV